MTKCFVEVENIEIDVGKTDSQENKHKCAFGIAAGFCRVMYGKLVKMLKILESADL
jgi:hypothetical protein